MPADDIFARAHTLAEDNPAERGKEEITQPLRARDAMRRVLENRNINSESHAQPVVNASNIALSDSTTPDSGPSKSQSNPSPSDREKKPKLQLLIVEDNGTDVLLVREAVQTYSLDLEIHVVDDGQKALDFIDQGYKDPDVRVPDIMLLDLNLPRRSGLEVLERLRQSGKCAHTAIIIFTSSDSARDRAAVAALGVTRYFRKPSRYEQFLQIGQLLKDICAEFRPH